MGCLVLGESEYVGSRMKRRTEGTGRNVMREGKHDIETGENRAQLPCLHSEEIDDRSGHQILHLFTRHPIRSRNRQTNLIVNLDN